MRYPQLSRLKIMDLWYSDSQYLLLLLVGFPLGLIYLCPMVLWLQHLALYLSQAYRQGPEFCPWQSSWPFWYRLLLPSRLASNWSATYWLTQVLLGGSSSLAGGSPRRDRLSHSPHSRLWRSLARSLDRHRLPPTKLDCSVCYRLAQVTKPSSLPLKFDRNLWWLESRLPGPGHSQSTLWLSHGVAALPLEQVSSICSNPSVSAGLLRRSLHFEVAISFELLLFIY